jgi:hypothetical protein
MLGRFMAVSLNCRHYLSVLCLCLPLSLGAQALWSEAQRDLPATAVFAEHYDLSKLHSLSNYASLKSRFAGTDITALTKNLSAFGIDETELSEIVIASQNATGSGGLYGIVSVPYNPKTVMAEVRMHKLLQARIGKTPVFCETSETGGLCMAMLDEIIAAFGSFERVKAIVDTRSGVRASLSSNPAFTDLLRERAEAGEVSGISNGARFAAWIRDGSSGQNVGSMDWSKLLPEVSAFAYTVTFGDRAHLNLRIECKSDAEALALRQMLRMALPASSVVGITSQAGVAQIQNVTIGGSESRIDVSLDTVVPGA